MQAYRKILKSLRESKDLSQEELARANIVSASQISNYEREKSHITVEKFFSLLDYFNIPLDIFQLLMGKPVANFREEIKLISLARERKSLTELEKLKDRFKRNKESTPRYEQLLLLTEVYISSVQGEEAEESVIEKLKSFFNSEQGDDYFKVILFSNVFFLFDPPYVEPKIRRFERRMKVYTQLSKDTDKEAQFYLNLINYYIKFDYYSSAERMIQNLKSELHGSYHVYEIEKLRFLEGKLLIKMGNIREGKALAQSALDRMKEYNWNTKADSHKNVLDHL